MGCSRAALISMSAVDQFTQRLQALSRQEVSDTSWDDWLDLVVAGLQADVAEAALVWGEGGVFRPVAFWPAGKPCGSALASLCEQSLSLRMPVTRPGSTSGALALPILIGDGLCGVIGLQFRTAVPKHAPDWIRWGMGWLASRHAATDTAQREALRERLITTLDLLMLVMAEKSASHACQVVVTEMAVTLDCERVSIGFRRAGQGVHLAALSHTADVQRKLDLTQALEAAMDEAADQGCSLSLPEGASSDSKHVVVSRAHEELVAAYGSDAVLSVPFAIDEENAAVVVFEWAEEKRTADAEHLALTLPPIVGALLHAKRWQERSLFQRCKDRLKTEARLVFGPRHVKRKLVASALVFVSLFAIFAKGDFRITTDATLEGAIRRQVVAPYDGYVSGASLRAGQIVKAGDLLATLDDRELKLEASRWSSQQTQYSSQMNDAVAQRNLAQMQIAFAQTRQAAAQRELSESLLARSRVEAPFDGVIVSGDLSQYLGGAVKKGQSLFEIAPLDSYRIILQIEENDIAWVQPGKKGALMLAALPGEEIPFTVTLVTSVAQVVEGRNRFRVEAKPEMAKDRLRPGMEGVGKVSIERARLVWIWTRRMNEWIRLQIWSWFGV